MRTGCSTMSWLRTNMQLAGSLKVTPSNIFLKNWNSCVVVVVVDCKKDDCNRERISYKAVSNTVWVCWKAVITEKTIIEECIDKRNSNDNYSYIAGCLPNILNGINNDNTIPNNMNLNEKVDYKTVIECVKVSNIFIGLKKTCLGVLDREEQDKNNEKGNKNVNYSASITRCTLSFALNTYLENVL